MSKLHYLFFIATTLLLYCQCSDKKKPVSLLQIEPFTAVDFIDSSHTDLGLPYKSEHYLVTGFESHEKNFAQIDSFMRVNDVAIRATSKKLRTYEIMFFRKTNITNNEHMLIYNRDYQLYSVGADLLYTYRRISGVSYTVNDPDYKYVFRFHVW